MNRYEFYPGDYLKDTLGLTMLEDGAYRRLLDHYYSTEQPIADGERFRVTRASSKAERDATQRVLDRFFQKTESVWSHRKVEQEIEKAMPKVAAARENGRKGGRPRTHREPSGLQADQGGTATQHRSSVKIATELVREESPTESVAHETAKLPKSLESHESRNPVGFLEEPRSNPGETQSESYPAPLSSLPSIQEKSRAVLRDPHSLRFHEPNLWPEVVEVANLVHEAIGLRPPKLAGKDPAVKALLELFAAGHTIEEFHEVAPKLLEHQWFSTVKKLHALTPSVFRDCLDAAPLAKAAGSEWDDD